MPVSYLEVDGVRMEIPPTRQAIRLLDDDGTVLFNIGANGTLGSTTFDDDLLLGDGGTVTQQASITTLVTPTASRSAHSTQRT